MKVFFDKTRKKWPLNTGDVTAINCGETLNDQNTKSEGLCDFKITHGVKANW